MEQPILGIDYKDIFHNSQAPMLIIGTDAPAYTMLDVNNAYLAATNTTREDLIGKPVFGVFPANPTDAVSKNIERTIFSFEQAISTKQPHTMYNYRYDIPIHGTDEFEERFWTTSNTPVMNEEGVVIYFIHSPTNVTELHKLQEKERKSLEALKNQQAQLYGTFMQAPVGIVILKGPQYVVELINPPLCEVYGRTANEMIGKPIFETLSYAKDMGFMELLDNVRLTGQPYKGMALPARFMRNGKLETLYFNFVYDAYREADGSISGVIAVATEVTELIQAKILVEEAEARARVAVDSVGLGTFDHNLLTNEIVTSKKSAQIFGLNDVISYTEFLSAFHPDDCAVREAAHAEAIVTGNLLYEARVVWPDTSVHWLRVEGKVFYNENETAHRILGVLLDITEQRKAKEEQRKLISLVENSVDLMSILKIDGFNAYINPAGQRLLGFSSEAEALTTPIAQLHRQEDYVIVEREVLPSVMQTGRWSGTMMVRNLQTGEVFPVFNNCFRIDDPASGNAIAVGAVMRDMRPELAAKQALADSEQLLRNITTAAPMALWMTDENGLVIYFNQTWVDWTGRKYEDNLGMGWLSSIYQPDQGKVEQRWKAAQLARDRYEWEFRLNHTDGKLHWCIVTGQPQYRGDGTFSGFIGAFVDSTEQKQLQQQKDDFIGIASHELKTPVTSIKGYAQVLERMLLKKGAIQEAQMMARMDGQINRLTVLISDLLDVTKINSGKLQFNDIEFEINAMAAEMVEDMQRTTEKHKLVFKPDRSAIVVGDRDRIGQVLSNLLSNAIKYSPVAEEIIIYTEVIADEVTLCVEDHGVGIPEDKLEKVFEQFYRVSGDMQHTFPGLGLGLYISSEIIKREGGRIWVNSTEGQGSTFCFALPLKK